MQSKLLFVATALTTVLLAARAEAQQYDVVSYNDKVATLRAQVQELEAEVAAAYEGGGGCDACCLSPATWFDSCCCGPTWAFSVNGDAWKDASEFLFENNFGNRFTLDATWDLGGSGMRGHLGGGYGLYDYHGRIRDEIAGSSAEQQIYLTAGVYRRGSGCCGDDWTWGAAYDYLHDNHYGQVGEAVDVHQVRFLVGRLLNPCNEFGVWGAVGIDDDPLSLNGDAEAVVEAQDQINLYWRRYYDFGGETMLYAGLADPNLALAPKPGGEPRGDDLTEVVIGLRGIAPLNCNVGLIGGVHYVIPSTSGGLTIGGGSASLEESWNVTFGVVWVRGCSLPVLPVADNGWMGKRFVGFID